MSKENKPRPHEEDKESFEDKLERTKRELRKELIGKDKNPPKATPKYKPRITVEFPETWSKEKKKDEKLKKILKDIGVQGNRNNKRP